MKTVARTFLFVSILVFFTACQKEVSLEPENRTDSTTSIDLPKRIVYSFFDTLGQASVALVSEFEYDSLNKTVAIRHQEPGEPPGADFEKYFFDANGFLQKLVLSVNSVKDSVVFTRPAPGIVEWTDTYLEVAYRATIANAGAGSHIFLNETSGDLNAWDLSLTIDDNNSVIEIHDTLSNAGKYFSREHFYTQEKLDSIHIYYKSQASSDTSFFRALVSKNDLEQNNLIDFLNSLRGPDLQWMRLSLLEGYIYMFDFFRNEFLDDRSFINKGLTTSIEWQQIENGSPVIDLQNTVEYDFDQEGRLIMWLSKINGDNYMQGSVEYY